jgi:uncharacterized protein (DUF983 family)
MDPGPPADGTRRADGAPRGVIDPTRRRGRTLLRGCLKRCGVCGQGHLFRRWFRMLERCPRCGLRFERVEGHWTGDIGVNTILSFGTLLAVLMGGFLLTWPDPPVRGLVVATITTALVAPLVFLPFSKTIWLAADLMMRPLAPGEVKDGFGPNDLDRAPEPRRTGR